MKEIVTKCDFCKKKVDKSYPMSLFNRRTILGLEWNIFHTDEFDICPECLKVFYEWKDNMSEKEES